MALHSPIPSIPADTQHAAKAVYSRDNFFLVVGDRLATLLADVKCIGFQKTSLSFHREKPVLAMVAVFQFVEMLSDPQAAEATRARVDWKYALHLSMNYPGLSSDALCQYRQWILREPVRLQDFQLILDRLMDAGLLMGHPGQVIKANAVLDDVCSVTRFERIRQALESAIGALAIYLPEWLQNITLPHWYTRYRVLNAYNHLPMDRTKRTAFTEAIGADAYYLLESFARDAQSDWARIQEVQALHEVWHQQFEHLSTCDTQMMERCSICGALLDRLIATN